MAKPPHREKMAQMMILRHGVRAEAVALERLAEARQQRDAAGLDRWDRIHAVIRELRWTARLRETADTDVA
jgi:hypothetical protein